MNFIVIAIVVIAILAVLAVALKFTLLLKGKGGRPSLYEAKGNLLTPAELKFLGVLDQVIGAHYRIMAQVRLADVINVKKGLDKQSWGRAFGKIKAKHLDFVACDPNDLSIKFAVELDDSSHAKSDRRKRDDFVNEAMKAAGIPLYRFAVKRSYDPEEIRRTIFGQA